MHGPKTWSRAWGADSYNYWQSNVPALCPEHRDRVFWACALRSQRISPLSEQLLSPFLFFLKFSEGKGVGSLQRWSSSWKESWWIGRLFYLDEFCVPDSVLQGKVQYKQYSGSHTPASARRSLFLLLLLKNSVCVCVCVILLPLPPEGICLLLMAFLFSSTLFAL